MVEKKLFPIATLLALGASAVSAQSYPDLAYGNGFMTACDPNNAERFGCSAFSAGLALMYNALSRYVPAAYCVPAGVNTVQMKDMVLKALREHPEIRHLQTAAIWQTTMEAAFPCPTTKK